MSSEMFVDKSGRPFIVNWEKVRMIVRSWLHSKGTYEKSRVVIETKWFGPNLYYVNYDFKKIREIKERETKHHLQRVREKATKSMDDTIAWLEMLMRDARAYDLLVTKQSRNTSARTLHNIHQSVRRGEVVVDGLKLVRDVSAEVVVVGAGFATGGAAVGILAGGSILKGAYKIQDTGKIRAGIAEATFTFGFGRIGMKLTAGKSVADTVVINMALGVPQSVFGDPVKAWISGDNVGSAFAGGLFKFVTGIPGSTLKELAPTMIGNALKSSKFGKAMAIPVQTAVNVLTDKGASKFGNFVTKKNGNQININLPKQPYDYLTDAINFDSKFIRTHVIKKQYSGTVGVR